MIQIFQKNLYPLQMLKILKNGTLMKNTRICGYFFNFFCYIFAAKNFIQIKQK